MADSKRRDKKKGQSVYTITGVGIFISSAGMEADLPQPTNGESNCWIASREADVMIPYNDINALEAVISVHFKATGRTYLPVDVFVDYYMETWEDYTGIVGRAGHLRANRSSALDEFFTGF